MTHIILLLQASPNQTSRTYHDFQNEADTMNHIASLYEMRLAKENPNAGQIQYRAEDLFRFIDSYKEFVALIFDQQALVYRPKDTEWIKDRLIQHFSGEQPQQNRRRRR